MEDSDILKRFDNDKLIDVVKNYKRYGYDDEIREKFRLRRSIDTIQSLL